MRDFFLQLSVPLGLNWHATFKCVRTGGGIKTVQSAAAAAAAWVSLYDCPFKMKLQIVKEVLSRLLEGHSTTFSLSC